MFRLSATKLISNFINEGFNVFFPRNEHDEITNDLDVIILSKMGINECSFIFLINATEKKELIKQNEDFFSNLIGEDGFKNLYVINIYITKEENYFANNILGEETLDNEKIHVYNLEADFANKKIGMIKETMPLKKVIERIINNSFMENKAFKSEEIYDIDGILNRSENFILTKQKVETPILTYGLMIINILMFIIMKIYELNLPEDVFSQGDALMKFGALFAPSVIFYGEYWRLATAMFVHIDVSHLLFNMFSLYIFGRTLEKRMGRISYLVVYFLAGILANFFTLFSPDTLNAISAGASGGIYALVGALLALTLIAKRSVDNFSFSNMALFIGLGVVIDIFSPENNSLAHTMGTILGFIISYVIIKFVLLKKVRKNINESA